MYRQLLLLLATVASIASAADNYYFDVPKRADNPPEWINADWSGNAVYAVGSTLTVRWITAMPYVDLLLWQVNNTYVTLASNISQNFFVWDCRSSFTPATGTPGNVFFISAHPNPGAIQPKDKHSFYSSPFNLTDPSWATITPSNSRSALGAQATAVLGSQGSQTTSTITSARSSTTGNPISQSSGSSSNTVTNTTPTAANAPIASSSDNNKGTTIGTGVGVGLGAALIIGAAAFYLRRRQQKRKATTKDQVPWTSSDEKSHPGAGYYTLEMGGKSAKSEMDATVAPAEIGSSATPQRKVHEMQG